jgi:hypothetical protein
MTRSPVPVLVTTTFLTALVVFRVWLPKLMVPGFTTAAGVPTGKPTVDQLSLETEEALIQFAVAVFKIVPVARLPRFTPIVIVSVSPLAIEANVTVTLLLPVWHTPLGVLEQLVRLSEGSRLSTTVTGFIARAVLFLTTVV